MNDAKQTLRKPVNQNPQEQISVETAKVSLLELKREDNFVSLRMRLADDTERTLDYSGAARTTDAAGEAIFDNGVNGDLILIERMFRDVMELVRAQLLEPRITVECKGCMALITMPESRRQRPYVCPSCNERKGFKEVVT